MDVNVSVKINASPEQAWSVFKDKTRWVDWYGVPIEEADWRENGSVRYGGQYGGVSGLANYREAGNVTIVGHWADDTYSVRADGNGCVFSKRICPKNGANFTASGYPNECKKQQDYLDKFRDIVEKEFSPRQSPRSAETPSETVKPAHNASAASAQPNQLNTKGQKGFSILNIATGVVFVIASVMMFADPSTQPGRFIAIPIGLLFWIVGAKTLKKVNGGIYAHEEKDVRKLLIGNTILFVLSCLIWGASIIIPMLTMRR